MVLYHAVVKRKKSTLLPVSIALPNHEPKGSNKALEKCSDEP